MKSVCFAPMRHQVGRHNFHHECCMCPANTKYFGNCSGTCIDVPLGVNQWGSNQTAIGMERGWFRTSNASLDIRECSNKEQCNGGSDPQKGCSLGATVCTDGFLVSSVGTTSITCVPCNTSGGDASFAQSHILIGWIANHPFQLILTFTFFILLIERGGAGKEEHLDGWRFCLPTTSQTAGRLRFLRV